MYISNIYDTYRIFNLYQCMYVRTRFATFYIFFISAWKFNKHSDSANSRRLFRFSLLHLPLLMVLLLSSKKYLANMEKQADKIILSHESANNDLLTICTSIAPATSSV